MRHRIPPLLAVLSIAWSTPAPAQIIPERARQILAAAQLPVATTEARREGVNSDEIRTVLDAMRRDRRPAYEATALIDTARVVRREHGPVDNFGAFVQSQLAAGKRGRELAAAIRAEHARQGKGHAARGAPGQSRGKANVADDTARGQGRSDAQPRGQGRGESQGRGRPPEARDEKQDNRGRGRGNPRQP